MCVTAQIETLFVGSCVGLTIEGAWKWTLEPCAT
jgi:hypothetical protein